MKKIMRMIDYYKSDLLPGEVFNFLIHVMPSECEGHSIPVHLVFYNDFTPIYNTTLYLSKLELLQTFSHLDVTEKASLEELDRKILGLLSVESLITHLVFKEIEDGLIYEVYNEIKLK